jgi:hypothetical protein
MPLLGTRGAASARGFGLFGPIPGDPFFSSTTLLLPGNGTNGAQNNTFLDSSTNAFSITRNGNTTQGTFSPFPLASGTAYSAAANGGSGYFDGSGDYLSIADNAALDLGTGDFTIEGWVYFSTAGVDGDGLISKRDDPTFTSGAWRIAWDATNQKINMNCAAETTTRATPVVSLSTWIHFAFVRSGTTLSCYASGTRGDQDASWGHDLNNTYSLLIGANVTGSNLLTGYLSNVRIVKGTAVYSGATYTVPTAPLTAITNTSLLLNFTNAGVLDATAKNDLETVGNAQISTAQSKWGGASIAFDGTGDWLLGRDNTNLQLGSGDFTIEGWVYLNATGVAYGLASKGAASTGWSVNVTSGNKLQFSYTATALTGATSLASGTWYHFAVVRNGSGTGNLRVYLNGTADATSAGAVTDNFNQTNVLYTGADRVGGSALNGYIDDLRITKGVARYTANFTAPTAAFPLF